MRLRRPLTTVRWRLTLVYGALFLLSGAALLAVTYTLVDHATLSGTGLVRQVRGVPPALRAAPWQRGLPSSLALKSAGPRLTAQQRVRLARLLESNTGKIAVALVGSKQRISDLHQLVIESAIALAIMAIISAALGWVVAGRVLRPLRTMTVATREISEANLHRRLAMRGPQDELRELADTIDGLLGRLEGAFDAERRFVANASHELRTPLTAARALIELVLSDPHATVQTYRATCQQVLEESEQQEQLIDALLALAHGQRGIDRAQPVDLTRLAGEAVRAHEPEAAARALELSVGLAPAMLSGDPRLIGGLISNLLDNALRHNVEGGRVRLTVARIGGRATLTIANSGPVVPAGEIGRLLQPFQRLAPDRIGTGEGLGLGLSIVAAIASAHGAALSVMPGPAGGLEVMVRFPPTPSGVTGVAPSTPAVLAT